MDKRYQVIFSNLHKDEDYFKDQMRRLGVPEAVSKEIIKKAPVVLKQDLSLKDARIYADAVYNAGGRVTIRTAGILEDNGENGSSFNVVPLKHFTVCPECGYKQFKKGTCIKCGLLFDGLDL